MRNYLLSKSVLLMVVLVLASCYTQNERSNTASNDPKSEAEARATLQTLLTSIENRNLDALKTTMSPTGKMELIIPQRAISYTVDEFVTLHQNWFKDTIWAIQTSISKLKVDQNIGFATTEAIYREPERDGKPYVNHIIVSYVLEKIDGQWYVIKDHACSLKKSTD